MTWARVLQEVRQMRFEELYARRQRRDLTIADAAEILGVTERTFRRRSGRYETEGVEGGSTARSRLGPARAPRRGAHRKKRPRKPLPGMMLHQDGSTHEWMPGCQWDLIVTLDDATSKLYN